MSAPVDGRTTDDGDEPTAKHAKGEEAATAAQPGATAASGDNVRARDGALWRVLPNGQRVALTAERKQIILEAIKAGNYDYVAAEHAGITSRTLREWKRRGREVLDRIEDAFDKGMEPPELDEMDVSCMELVADLITAERQSEMFLVANWHAAASEDWRAARDLLARRQPERWRERTETTLVGDVDRPVQVTTIADVAQKAAGNPAVLEKLIGALEDMLPEDTPVEGVLDLEGLTDENFDPDEACDDDDD